MKGTILLYGYIIASLCLENEVNKPKIPWREDRSIPISPDDKFRRTSMALHEVGEKQFILYHNSKENDSFIHDSHIG